MKLWTALILAVAAAFAAPSAASAAKVIRGSDYYRYRADPGEQNRLSVTASREAIVFKDSGAGSIEPTKKHAPGLCRKLSEQRLRCVLPKRRFTLGFGITVFLGDGNDTSRFKNVKGGRVGGFADGEEGDDTLTASPRGSFLAGGPGEDVLQGGDGDDSLEGGTGTDVMRGGEGRDAARYPSRGDATPPITVTLDGQANDGEAGENDAVGADVEDVEGGTTVTGNDGANTLSGGDLVRGLDGDDRLFGSGTLVAGDGNDTGTVGAGGRLDGGFGNDRLTGDSEGMSEVHGGPGNDTLDLVDEGCDGVECSVASSPDTFDCGPGTDVAYVDPGDTAPPDCEIVGLVIDDRPVTLRATEGDDRLTGSLRNERIEGLGGDDFLGGRGGRDHLIGGDGDDVLDGDRRAGFDGKGYKDRLSGGDGNDTVRARDDGRDSIRCGAGDDTVTADKGDRVADDCETVSRR